MTDGKYAVLAATWQVGRSGDIDETVDNFVHKHQVGYHPVFLKQ